MNITITNNPSEADDEVISSGLQNYNRQYSSGSFNPLSIYSRTNDDVIIGGLIGVTYGNWLHVHEFWVSEAFRGRSIGSKILDAAEVEAIRRSCIGVTLGTYSFQSLQFYLTRGYEEFGSLSGYANEFKRHYLQKRFENYLNLSWRIKTNGDWARLSVIICNQFPSIFNFIGIALNFCFAFSGRQKFGR